MEDRRVLGDLGTWVADRLDGDARAAVPATELPSFGAEGVGSRAMWDVLREQVLPTAFPADHPRYLAFVGGAPSAASVLADMALSAAAVYGGSELEAGAVVAAERAALRWLADLVGFDARAHGTFVSGGSMANLSALVAARHGRVRPDGLPPRTIVAAASAHPSVSSAAAIMGCAVAPAGAADRPLDGAGVEEALGRVDADDVVAVVASAGATNTGAVDHLDEIARVCAERGLWLHVDAAYGGAALLAPAVRDRFRGIERADSVTVDPHKWLFTPFDCAAVLYRAPERARAAHRQRAGYLDPVEAASADNPADLAVHLTRRARGLPVWASLLANGTDAYVDAVETCLATATHAAKRVEASPVLELVVEPALSVVLFRRTGWQREQYVAWSERARSSGLALVTPTTFDGEVVLRLCFVNPRTSTDDVDAVLDSLEVSDAGR